MSGEKKENLRFLVPVEKIPGKEKEENQYTMR